MTRLSVCAVIALISMSSAKGTEHGQHLFILSGQSNMARLNSDTFFTPIVEAEFGKGNVIVVRDAKGGQPISRWYRNWKPGERGKEVALNEDGTPTRANGELYQRLIEKVVPAIKGKQIQTVTLVWMQGEKDAKMQWSDVYAASLRGLIEQVRIVNP